MERRGKEIKETRYGRKRRHKSQCLGRKPHTGETRVDLDVALAFTALRVLKERQMNEKEISTEHAST